MKLISNEKWLRVDLEGEHQVLSWALVGGGRVRARHIAWLFATNQDLGKNTDPLEWARLRMESEKLKAQIAFLTSRRLRAVDQAVATVAGIRAEVIATVGLSNGLHIAHAGSAAVELESSRYVLGTINILCRVNASLSESALLEASSLVTEARTAAVLQGGVRAMQGSGVSTGTGTDCIAVACPVGLDAGGLPYAGKHTAVGQAIGAAVFDAVSAGVERWIADWKSKALRGAI